ncbi:MAG: 3-hydroxybutyryl-CoA dehydrogenase [Nitriliruptoraceae bacterium]
MTIEIARVGVVGCGTMGAGIAELVARNGVDVRFVETDEAALDRGWARIRASLDRGVERGRLDAAQREAVEQRIQGSTVWSTLSDCDLIVEAVPETLAAKQEVFRRMDRVARADAILATNTSSLPVMDIAVHSSRPNRVVGFHFFNPAPVMPLVELVRTVIADDAVVEAARQFAERVGKVAVVVGDRRGFIANQLLFPYLNQAVWMVEGGYATKEDVDTAMRLGAGLPMGPIALTDMVGIDTFHGIMDAIHEEVGDTRFAPRPILSQLARAEFTGRKAGRGFYTYEAPGSSRVVADDEVRPGPDPSTIASWTRIGVMGTGEVATGLVEACARAGFEVNVVGRTREEAERCAAQASLAMQRMVNRSLLTTDEMIVALGRIRPTIAIEDVEGCDLVVDAGEDLDAAARVATFASLGERLPAGTLLATTSASVPVIDCAMASGRPELVVGLHLFTPSSVMRLVEIVTTVRVDDAVVEQARAFVERIDRVGVLCGDRAGLIVNTLLFPYLNDAVKLLESHYATAEQIDTTMRLGCGYPQGPFELLDTIGLDVALTIIERLCDEYRQNSHEPAPLLRHLVEMGFLGHKSGRGFYVYD